MSYWSLPLHSFRLAAVHESRNFTKPQSSSLQDRNCSLVCTARPGSWQKKSRARTLRSLFALAPKSEGFSVTSCFCFSDGFRTLAITIKYRHQKCPLLLIICTTLS